MGLAEKLWYINLPPSKSASDAAHQVLSDDTGAAAADFDWYAQLVTAGAQPKGKCFLAVEAVTKDTYIRFGPTSTTATTSSTGLLIKADQPAVKFYVDPVAHAHIDHIATGTGVLKVYVCSPIGERRDI